MRRDLGNRATPVNRDQMKRPLVPGDEIHECIHYARHGQKRGRVRCFSVIAESGSAVPENE